MSKKDYIVIAETINKERATWKKESIGYAAVESVALALANSLKKDNAHFNHEIFMNACGFEK